MTPKGTSGASEGRQNLAGFRLPWSTEPPRSPEAPPEFQRFAPRQKAEEVAEGRQALLNRSDSDRWHVLHFLRADAGRRCRDVPDRWQREFKKERSGEASDRRTSTCGAREK